MLENTEQNNLNAPTEEEIEDMKKESERTVDFDKMFDSIMSQQVFADNRDKTEEYPEDVNSFITFKCKPTYNFQSIEFEYTCSKDELEEMFELYKALVNGLMAIAPAQPSAIPAKELASARQKEIMDKFGIKYKASTTREEAQALIKESIDFVSKK